MTKSKSQINIKSQIGYTLMEILVVIVIMSMLVVIAMASLPNLLERRNVDNATESIIGLLEDARGRTLGSREVSEGGVSSEYGVRFNLDTNPATIELFSGGYSTETVIKEIALPSRVEVYDQSGELSDVVFKRLTGESNFAGVLEVRSEDGDIIRFVEIFSTGLVGTPKADFSSWGNRIKITFDNSASSENLMGFPVLIKLNNNIGGSGFAYEDTQTGGKDIRFTYGEDVITLPYEIEEWNTGGDSFVWVRVPKISAGSDKEYIYMYYDNDDASGGQNSERVWDDTFKMVHHFEETSGQVTDSSGDENHGAMTAITPVAAGKIGRDFEFNGSTSKVTVTNVTTKITGPLTMSGWIKKGLGGSLNRFIIQNSAYTNFEGQTVLNGYAWGSFWLNKLKFYSGLNGDQGWIDSSSGLSSNGAWEYIAVTLNDSAVSTFYHNGEKTDSMQSRFAGGNPSEMEIGKQVFSTPAIIELDELRISDVARSAAWAKAEYLNQSDPTPGAGFILSMIGEVQ